MARASRIAILAGIAFTYGGVSVAWATCGVDESCPGAPPASLMDEASAVGDADLTPENPVVEVLESHLPETLSSPAPPLPPPLPLPLSPSPPSRRHRRTRTRLATQQKAAPVPPASIAPPPTATPIALLPGAAPREPTTRAAPAAEVRALLTLVVNTVETGEALVLIREHDFWVEVGALKDANLTITGATIRTIGGKRFASLESIGPAVAIAFDEPALALHLQVQPELLATTFISLQPSAPRQMVYQRTSSAFLNYALHLTDFRELNGFAELGVNLGNGLFYSSVSISSQTFIPVRGLTNFTYDERPALRRWTFGDSFASTGALGGGVFVGGVTMARGFDIDPYFVRSPMLGFGGAALAPSTLEVYVNGTLVRREALPPGPFQVSNVPINTGAGVVRYVVRDTFGRGSDVSSPYYNASGLLAKGLQDYSYSIGFRRDRYGIDSFNYGPPVFLGRHRYGLTRWLTVGARVEASLDRLSSGVSATMSTPLGQLDIAAAASVSDRGIGFAESVSWGYNARYFSLGLRAAAASDHYATLATGPLDDRALLQLSAYSSVSLGPKVMLSTQVARSTFRDSGTSNRLMGQLTARILPRVDVLLSAAVADSPHGAVAWEVYGGITISDGGRRRASAGWRQRKEAGAAELDFSQPLPRGPGVGYRFNANLGTDERSFSTQMDVQTSFGRYSASYHNVDGASHATVDAAGSIAYIHGAGFFLSRPIEQAFGVIQVPGVRGVRGYLNNQLVGRTDRRGNLLVPDAAAYYANRLSIEETDVALDRTLPSLEQVLAPSLRGAFIARFDVHRSRFLRGRIEVGRGPVAFFPKFGELTVTVGDKRAVSPLGGGGEFELEDLPPGRYRAEVEWAGGRCLLGFDSPATGKPVIDLGTIHCEPSAAAPGGAP